MSVRQTERREVRLTKAEDELLREELADRGLTFAGWVREQLGALAEERARRKRIDAFERLMRLAQEGAQPWPDDDDDPATRAVREAIDAGAEDMMRVE